MQEKLEKIIPFFEIKKNAHFAFDSLKFLLQFEIGVVWYVCVNLLIISLILFENLVKFSAFSLEF